MKLFLTEDFLLQTQTARTLYHDFAENMPIFDYHCHLPVAEIAADKTFENLTDIWLRGTTTSGGPCGPTASPSG